MASDVVAQLADSLARTQVGELSYKGQGLKLDNAESGEYKEQAHYWRDLNTSSLQQCNMDKKNKNVSQSDFI